MLRTHTCGELNKSNVGQTVKLCGWVDTVRDHGVLVFIDLRDRYGKTQIVYSGKLEDFKKEDCVQVEGKVQLRPKGTENAKLPTGEIEITETKLTAFSVTPPLPFEVTKSTDTNEELRMKYRYLDLRNPAVQKNLFVRHKVYQTIRRTLDKNGFTEVETPILTKSTPEGARDYLVPSRVNQGQFFALPQSPQLFKQILMVSGFDRYFQIAKCFRDEDLRADRQPEFTQLDMEMSFLEEKDLFVVIEDVLKEILKEVLGKDLKVPFVQLTYHEAMDNYGSDKPDLRFGMKFSDLSEAVKSSEFKVFKDVVADANGRILAIALPGGASASRKDIDNLTEFAKAEGAGGLAYFKVEAGKLDSPIAKFFAENIQKDILTKTGAKDGDLILIVADQKKKAQKVLGAVRLHAAKWKNLIPQGEFHFSWVTDFPLFQWNEEDKRWDSEHHPFTQPNAEDWAKLKNNEITPDKVRSRAYDLVLNGNEIASGSIRIHNDVQQSEIFQRIGLDEKEVQTRFGFLLGALKFGAPPHGGVALGIDRIITILLGLESIREVIAFPKNAKAVCPMTEAPSVVNERQLKDLGIKIR